MYRSLLPLKKWHTLFGLFVLLMLSVCLVQPASAQKRKKNAQSQSSTSAPATQTAPPSKKNITPLRSSDAGSGSRVTITSDVPLNDYSAYRSGDRYYVVIPEANAPHAQSLKGRGFEDVQVQKRGNDAVLSFRLQPGTSAHVNQKFNKLDVVFDAPGNSATGTSTNPNTTGNNASTQPSSSSNPQGSDGQKRGNNQQPAPSPAGPNNKTENSQPNSAINRNQINNAAPGTIPTGVTSSAAAGTGETAPPSMNPVMTPVQPSTVASPAPSATASPEVSAAATPQEVAQTQKAPTVPSAVTSGQTASSGTSLGAVLSRNLPVVILAGILLLSVVLFVLARSRAGQTSTPPPAVIGGDKRAEEILAREPASIRATASPASEQVLTEAMVPPARMPDETLTVESTAPASEEIGAASAAALEPEVSAPAESAVDIERVETEVNRLLDGEKYDRAVIGSSDENVRQLVAAGLLAALAGRQDAERRERARMAFIEHGYHEEATRTLRTAIAPAERASAARHLGLVGEQSATPHLIAALEDDSVAVRRSAVEALAALQDPAAVEPLNELLRRERRLRKDRRVDPSSIQYAIEASTAVEVSETTPTPAATAPAVEETAALETSAATQPEIPEVLEATRPAAMAAPQAEDVSEVTLESPAVEASSLAEVEAPETVEPEAAAPAIEAPSTGVLSEAVNPQITDAVAPEASVQEVQPVPAIEAQSLLTEEPVTTAEEEVNLSREEAERRRFEEEERARVEEEARQRAEAEIARREAAEAAARRRVEEEARAQEEARQRAEEEARLQAEAEAQRLEEQRRAEEQQRLAGEEAARLRAEEVARLRAEEDERQRVEAEAWLRLEEARLQAEQEATQAEESAQPVEAEAALPFEEVAPGQTTEAETVSESAAPVEVEMFTPQSAETVSPAEPLSESRDVATGDWFEVDISEAPEPANAQALESNTAETYPEEAVVAEPLYPSEPAELWEQQAAAPETSLDQPGEKQIDELGNRELELAVAEKGLDIVEEEFTAVPNSILRRLGSEVASVRAAAVTDLSRIGGEDAFREVTAAFDDPVQIVRDAAARALYNIDSDRAASFTRALREAPPERRRNIGQALASSGLASEAISNLMGESREKTYDAFSLLFLMSKAGEVRPLMQAIEEHPNNEVRLAVVKLLALSGQQEILPAFRRLAVRGSLPTEVRSAVMEAIYQLSTQTSNDTSSVA